MGVTVHTCVHVSMHVGADGVRVVPVKTSLIHPTQRKMNQSWVRASALPW